MKIVSIVGARPQFIKAAPVSRALRESGHTEFLLHTGQHYDYGMSDVFFKQLEIPEPDVNLDAGSGPHGRQTGKMLIGIEKVLLTEKPDRVLVYGDTNSTLAGALAAVKLHVPVAHVEAGLRSFNRRMPEEYNRVLTDHCSDILFCPTQTAIENLEKEGITEGVHLVGDVMYDSTLYNIKLARKNSDILTALDLEPGNYALSTVHRQENTDNPSRLSAIFSALENIAQEGLPVVMPLHPRTRKTIARLKIRQTDGLNLIEPVPYLDMLMLEKHAKLILTDSGGVQKEAYWFNVPCVTLRDETEWVETVDAGWNVVAGADTERILNKVRNFGIPMNHPLLFGDGQTASRCVQIIEEKSCI